MTDPGKGAANGGTGPPTSGASTYYQSFLEKMRHASASELVKAIKSFITTFRDTPVAERSTDNGAVEAFLKQTEASILAHPLWKNSSQEELDNVREVLEKHLMTKIYDKSFSQTTEEQEKDAMIKKKIFCIQFIEPKHLDIPTRLFTDELQPSWALAGKELLKVNSYKAPRDKLVCILNCCKVIYNLLSVSAAQMGDAFGADDFLPLLIYVIIRSNPDKLHSNLEYISRFRNPEKMISETMYFFTNIVCAVQFVEALDGSSLSMDVEEYKSRFAEREADYEVEKAKAEDVSNAGAAALDKAPAGDDAAAFGSAMRGGGSIWNVVPADTLAWLSEHQNSREELFKFRGAVANDLRVGDVGALLSDYKRLVEVVDSLMTAYPAPQSQV